MNADAPSVLSPVKILYYNAYLIPQYFVGEKSRTCINQPVRARALGDVAKQHDFIQLQEMWGSNADKIEQLIQNTHVVHPRYGSIGFSVTLQPYLSLNSAIDTVRYWFNGNGGLWPAWTKKATLIDMVHYRFKTFGNFEANAMPLGGTCKGVVLTLFDMSYAWPDCFLLLMNTHLDCEKKTSEYCPIRNNQLLELMQLLNGLISKYSISAPHNFAWNKCAVILGGDFNINNQEQYEKMKNEVFKGCARDLYVETHPQLDSQTAGYTYNSEENSYAFEAYDNGRLDYIWAFDKFKQRNGTVEFLKLKCDRCEVVKQPKGSEISDHWGMSLVVAPDQEAMIELRESAERMRASGGISDRFGTTSQQRQLSLKQRKLMFLEKKRKEYLEKKTQSA